MTEMPASEALEEPRRLFGMTLGGFVGRFGALFGLIILVVVLSVLVARLPDPGQPVEHRPPGGVNALLSVGMLLAIITAGIDLSVGSVLALSMSVLALLAIKMHVNPYLAMLACAGGRAGMGLPTACC